MLQPELGILDQQFSEEFKEFFLFAFTKELISHSGTKELIELETVLEEEKAKERKAKREIKLLDPKQQIKEQVKEKLKKSPLDKEKLFPSMMNQGMGRKLPPMINQRMQRELPPIINQGMQRELPPSPRRLNIQRPSVSPMHFPTTILPPRLQYIRPIITNVQLDLGMLNPLLKDPRVESIECNGEDENLIVISRGEIKKTNITLTREEINQVIRTITETARIPFQEGILRIAIGRFTLLAIISDVVSPRFIIKKMALQPRFLNPEKI